LTSYDIARNASTMREQDDSFFIRWSRRKQAARQARPGQAADEQPHATGNGHAESAIGSAGADARTDGPPEVSKQNSTETAADEQDTIPRDLAGVDIDALNYESDFTRFMQNDVPEALRRRALRQLWRSDPILANVDGLNDYDDDFTDTALAVKVLQTAHKVGRGYLDDDEDAAAVQADPDEGTSSEGPTEGSSYVKADGDDEARAAGETETTATGADSGDEISEAPATPEKSNTQAS
jgi:hypothetical protein